MGDGDGDRDMSGSWGLAGQGCAVPPLSQSEWQCLVLVSGSCWCQVVEQSVATSPARSLAPGMSPDGHAALVAGLQGCEGLEVGTGGG